MLLVMSMLCGTALALPSMGELTAKSAVLYDTNGNMLYEMNAQEALQPASVTKIMTMLLLVEAIDSGQVQLTDMITGSAYAESMGGTQIWLQAGEQLTVDEMLKAVAVGSANDCAVAIAEHLAGSEAAFVEKMNARAVELGCTNTTFINANGLDLDGQQTLTSAQDLALISIELLTHPLILDYTTIWMDSIRNGEFSLANTNKMLNVYDGMIGLKTGYISQAGYCISAAATRADLTLIAVVMGAPTSDARTQDVTTLLNYGYANFTTYTPAVQEQLQPIAVEMGKQTYLNVAPTEIPTLTVEKEQADAISVTVQLPDVVQAPIVQGDVMGQAVVQQGEDVLCTIDLCAQSTVARLQYQDILHKFTCVLLMKQG